MSRCYFEHCLQCNIVHSCNTPTPWLRLHYSCLTAFALPVSLPAQCRPHSLLPQNPDVVQLTLGSHQLEGKAVPFKKPLALLDFGGGGGAAADADTRRCEVRPHIPGRTSRLMPRSRSQWRSVWHTAVWIVPMLSE